MVHNGIEYGDMQMIAESYFLMKHLLGMTPAEMHQVFGDWNEGELDSYLIEITRDIMAYKDEETGEPLVDMILDTAGQKGTGKWTSVSALDLGTPAPTVAEAVFARFMSALKEERVAASQILGGPAPRFDGDQRGIRRGDPPGALRQQDLLLRPGLPTAEDGGRRATTGSSTSAASP